MRAGRPPRSTPLSATALVAASTDSKSMKAMPRNSPSFSTHLMREMAPQSLKAARTVSSSMFQARLPRKIELDGSPGSLLPAAPPARSFFAVAISTFIARPSRSFPLSLVAASAAAAEANWRKPAPLNLPESACVSHSIFVISPHLAKTSLICSSVTDHGRLPRKTRPPSPSAAGVAADVAGAASSAASSASPVMSVTTRAAKAAGSASSYPLETAATSYRRVA
mmetsp:Transcript_21258/g.62919  ORF Transcript_21258/g.62919 Transcript_21258/m.62919 type:complete len:224 (-) Transcript_21258:2121-2792(-)